MSYVYVYSIRRVHNSGHLRNILLLYTACVLLVHTYYTCIYDTVQRHCIDIACMCVFVLLKEVMYGCDDGIR